MPRLLVLVTLLWPTSAFAQEFDLLLKGGHVIDARNSLSAVRDVAIKDGRVAAVATNIAAARAIRTIDVAGLYVVPGLIDLHAHVYRPTVSLGGFRADNNAVYPDGFSFRNGVTTFVDPGGSGWRNFEDLKDRVIDRSETRVLAFINIVGRGSAGGKYEQDLADMDVKATADMALKYKGLIVGVKSAHYSGPEWDPFTRAVEAGTIANIPVMIDFGSNRPERPLYDLLTRVLRPGDIYSHVYSGIRGEQDPKTLGPAAGAGRGPQARRALRRRPWRRQLPLARRRAAHERRVHAGHDLNRPAHREHERGTEGHPQSDEQVPRDGYAARPGHCRQYLERGQGDQTGAARQPVGRVGR